MLRDTKPQVQGLHGTLLFQHREAQFQTSLVVA